LVSSSLETDRYDRCPVWRSFTGVAGDGGLFVSPTEACSDFCNPVFEQLQQAENKEEDIYSLSLARLPSWVCKLGLFFLIFVIPKLAIPLIFPDSKFWICHELTFSTKSLWNRVYESVNSFCLPRIAELYNSVILTTLHTEQSRLR
jgi:hypothetical protein